MWGAQVQPTTQLVEVIQYLDKAKADWDGKNLVGATQACGEGERRLGRVPDNDESRRMRGQLNSLCKEVRSEDKRLKERTEQVAKLTAAGRLTSAQTMLDGIREFQADVRFKDAESGLEVKKDNYEKKVGEARRLASGQKKQAHNLFKEAQEMNKDVSLKSEIQATNGCYGGCKAAVWAVILAGGGAAGYYGWDQYEKNKKK